MDTATIRERLHNYLEIADDKVVKAIYNMVSVEIEEGKIVYTEGFTKELSGRYDRYKKDPSKAISAGESKERIQKILDSKQKK